MIYSLGDLNQDSTVNSPINEPTFQGIYFLLAGIGLYAFVSSIFESKESSTSKIKTPKSKDQDYILEVDVTGKGNWREQATGSKGDLKKEASRIAKSEGMKTRII